MVSRKTGWRIVTLAVAVYATASADPRSPIRGSARPGPPAFPATSFEMRNAVWNVVLSAITGNGAARQPSAR